MPSRLARASGYKRKKSRRIAGKEPKPHVGAPNMPSHIRADPVAAECWIQQRKHVVAMKVMTKRDNVALEGLCIAYSRALAADKDIRTYGLVVNKLGGGLAANPAAGISRSAWSEVRKFATEFGLTPASRTRVREVADDLDPKGAAAKESSEDFLFKGHVVGSIGK